MNAGKFENRLSTIAGWLFSAAAWVVLLVIAFVVAVHFGLIPDGAIPANPTVVKILSYVVGAGMFGPAIFVAVIAFIAVIWKLFKFIVWCRGGGLARMSTNERRQWNNAIFASLWILSTALFLTVYDNWSAAVVCALFSIPGYLLASVLYGVFALREPTDSRPVSPPASHVPDNDPPTHPYSS